MSKARGLADLGNVYNDGALSNRNLIINGAMQVAQRGTSFTANGYGLDRWTTYNSGGTATLSQQSFASGDAPAFGLTSFVRIVRAAPTSTYFFGQKVEDVRLSDEETLTFSFYAKASAAITLPCRITQEFGSGGSVGVNITAQNASVTTSWQRFSVTFNMASLSGKTIGTGSSFDPVFDIPATTATIEITGVQLEVGDTATPFEHRSYGQELALCQRYYEKNFNVFDAPVAGLALPDRVSGMAFAGSAYGFNLNFSVTKRGLPTMVYYRGDTTGSASSGTVCRYNGSGWVEEAISGAGRQTTQFIAQDVSTSGLTVGYTYLVQVGFTADAEL
jgi:hypothetical protein